jgi:hypothetical protein
MLTFSRVVRRAVLGIGVTYVALVLAAYARELSWAYPVTHPLETLTMLAMYPSDSELVIAKRAAWDDGRGHHFLLLPLGALLGLVSGALLPRRAAALHVLGRLLSFGLVAVVAFSAASALLVISIGAPLRIWSEFLRINNLSLPFVFAYAATWHGLCGLVAYRWRQCRPANTAA